MSQTLEQVALRVAADVFGPATDHQSCQFMSAIVAYSEALIAALGAQEPIAQVDMNKASCVHWLNSTDPDTFHGTKLYAAPQIPQREGWQLVPKEMSDETNVALGDKYGYPPYGWKATYTCILTMLAAAPKPEDV